MHWYATSGSGISEPNQDYSRRVRPAVAEIGLRDRKCHRRLKERNDTCRNPHRNGLFSVGLEICGLERLDGGLDRDRTYDPPDQSSNRFLAPKAGTKFSYGDAQVKPPFRRMREECVRNLHQDAGAVAGARIGADRAAMFEIAENADRVRDDLMRLLALDIGDEADAAGILLQRQVVKAFGGRAPGMLARGFKRFRGRVRRQRIRHDAFALELRPAHLSPLAPARASSSSSAHLGRSRHPPGHRAGRMTHSVRWAAHESGGL